MKALMIDNYDSFTFNLVQYFQELDVTVEVERNDAISAERCLERGADFFVISPGPSTPDHAGVSLALIKAAAARGVPLLGVCLGHQAIGQAFGGKVVRARVPMHGKVSAIRHEGVGVFNGLPTPVLTTRYHSLIVERASLPSELEVTGETEDGTIMALRHRQFPVEGVQFHPESVLTQHGKAMLKNFIASVAARRS